MRALWEGLQELRRYPSAIVGLTIILLLVATSIYAIVSIPYHEAIRQWRGGQGVWDENPKLTHLTWNNWFSRKQLPETIVVDTQNGAKKTVQDVQNGLRVLKGILGFDFPYDGFPRELPVFFATRFHERPTPVRLQWRKPNGETVKLKGRIPSTHERYSRLRVQCARTACSR